MKKAIWIVSALLALINLAAWSREASVMTGKEILLKKDREFCRLTQKKGIAAALYLFLAEKGRVLPRFGFPICGKESVRKVLKDTGLKEAAEIPPWEPLFAHTAAAGDLGYSYGRFKKPGTKEGADAQYGYYGIVWGKNSSGKWEIVFCQGLLPRAPGNNAPPAGPGDFKTGSEPFVKADREFSKLSVKSGTAPAFYRYIAADGVALSFSGPPATKDKYLEIMNAEEKQKLPRQQASVLEWEPIFADVSASGELGYTHGRYRLTFFDKSGKKQAGSGYYVSVWEKQEDGAWKFVFDAGSRDE